MWFDRTKILIGENGVEKLKNSHVVIVGVGGVGGYVCQMLVRAGIGEVTIVDFDKVDETNINRQVVANVESVGKFKVDVMKQMFLKINPDCKIHALNERFCNENATALIPTDCSYVVDAIDSVQNKVDLIAYCKENNLPIVSAMGAGNRIDIPVFKVVDIYKTSNDGLARVMRKKLREREIENLDVVTCETPALKNDEKTIGSMSYYPAMCGCVIAAHVVNKVLKG